jgi:hypothetical protein
MIMKNCQNEPGASSVAVNIRSLVFTFTGFTSERNQNDTIWVVWELLENCCWKIAV